MSDKRIKQREKTNFEFLVEMPQWVEFSGQRVNQFLRGGYSDMTIKQLMQLAYTAGFVDCNDTMSRKKREGGRMI